MRQETSQKAAAGGILQDLLDLLERQGAWPKTQEEAKRLEEGVRLFLWENGIGPEETRPYFYRYVDAHLGRILRQDLLSYFLLYPEISEARQLAAEYRADKGLPRQRKVRLYRCMEELYRQGLGSRYVPAAEIQEILGPWM